MNNEFPLSEKFIDFILDTTSDADFLEGTTASGKTTVGAGVKFMLKVSQSSKKLHIIASKTTGTAEKNIIQQDNGILDIHKDAIYYGNGDKDYKIPHIKYEDKIIFILGYDNVEKWKLVLGSQFGCVFIDEINTANIEFVREISTRNDYLLATLNPDDPNLEIYKEFINRAKPVEKYKDDIPKEILQEFSKESVKGWNYWFFSFYDNLSLSKEDIEKKKRSAPKGTKLYKNKILGLRGKATGVIFSNFDDSNIITKEEAKKKKFKLFSMGLDTSYSQKTSDTIALIFIGITQDKELIVLDEEVLTNKDNIKPFAPSDIVPILFSFLEKNRKEWGLARDVYIDCADQATKMEINKYKRSHPNVYNIHDSYKKVTIIDRIHLMLGWLNSEYKAPFYYVLNTCKNHISELNTYSWKEDKYEPEDKNDHTINACQYAWIPFRKNAGEYESNI